MLSLLPQYAYGWTVIRRDGSTTSQFDLQGREFKGDPDVFANAKTGIWAPLRVLPGVFNQEFKVHLDEGWTLSMFRRNYQYPDGRVLTSYFLGGRKVAPETRIVIAEKSLVISPPFQIRYVDPHSQAVTPGASFPGAIEEFLTLDPETTALDLWMREQSSARSTSSTTG